MTKIGVIQYPSSNCDYDTKRVLEEVIGVKTNLIWYKDIEEVDEVDGIILPGGFSYGDYLRAGAIAAHTPITNEIKKNASKGKPVLGICNGFQILTESGMLPGALMTNREPKFLCKHIYLKVKDTDSFFTRKFKENEVIKLPIAHKEGNFFVEDNELNKLQQENRICLEYCDKDGVVSDETNPNGSKRNIAAVLNEEKNVMGMMPHPERASEEVLGSEDGKRVLEGLVEEANQN